MGVAVRFVENEDGEEESDLGLREDEEYEDHAVEGDVSGP